MIISASRRTDIPAYYMPWLLNRLGEGFVLARNPMNSRQVSKISLSPQDVGCIVFWTKNPIPLLPCLAELAPWRYYVQFTLTPYGKDVEPNLPEKAELLGAFAQLAQQLGPRRVIWRYDPILFNPIYTPQMHLERFTAFADAVAGTIAQCTISFLDYYANAARRWNGLDIHWPGDDEKLAFAAELSAIARARGITMTACAETLDLRKAGVLPARCIDPLLIESIWGKQVNAGRDSNQRPSCGCAASVDIGLYNSCSNGCRYCYANHSEGRIKSNLAQYDETSPLLCSKLGQGDIVKERKTATRRGRQIDMLDK